MSRSTDALDFLFPAPSLPQSSLSPSHFPGVSPESTFVLQNVLKDNHTKWHIFFNEQRFHNHAAHRAIASWALGATANAIESGYRKDCGYEKPAFKSPGPIFADNFNEHLGDDKYYSAYLDFFKSYVMKNGISEALEDFLFSRNANLGSNSLRTDPPAESQPKMLNRFLSGVLHPMIHTGYGAEFNLPGMIVEGLAQTAVHLTSPDFLEPLHLFEDSEEPITGVSLNKRLVASAFNSTLNAFDTALDKVLPQTIHLDVAGFAPLGVGLFNADKPHAGDPKRTTATNESRNSNVKQNDALSILARVLSDSRFASSGSSEKSEAKMFDATVQKHGAAIGEYTCEWDLSGGLDKKIEELAWVVSILYGVAGWTDMKLRAENCQEPEELNADFFFMHLVTSSIFLPAICVVVGPKSQARILKAYFCVVLTWAIARGRPRLNIKDFVEEMQDFKSCSPPASSNIWESTWMRMIAEARTHHDEHLTKLVRALAGWSSAFGTIKARTVMKVNPVRFRKDRYLTKDETDSAGLGMGLNASDVGTNSAEGKQLERRKEEDERTGAAEMIQAESSETPSQASDPRLNLNSENSRKELQAASSVVLDSSNSNGLLNSSLSGSEYLDGNFFMRTSVLTLGRMGWDLDKKQKSGEDEFWDFKGFFDQQAPNHESRKAKF